MIPLTAKRVAFLGSSPSSFNSAPYADPTWEIWACGPGAHVKPTFKNNFNRWFELHDMAENDPQYGTVLDAGYFEWLAALAKEKPVYYRPPLYPGLKGETVPWDEMVARHGGYFLDSTIAWAMAYLYDYLEVEEVGLWGVDFATDAERQKQRKGAKHFLQLFRMKGVKVTIPEVSDMSFDPPPYPDLSKLTRKVTSHLQLLEPERSKTEKNIDKLREALLEQEKHLERIKGTTQTLEHVRDNWG